MLAYLQAWLTRLRQAFARGESAGWGRPGFPSLIRPSLEKAVSYELWATIQEKILAVRHVRV